MPANSLVEAAHQAKDARQFFETHFTPGIPIAGHFTGYYEPEIPGSSTPSSDFPVPLHSEPPGGCKLPRAEIEPHLSGQEIVWLRDEVDRFFTQVQGSARISLTDGTLMRVGHMAKNGHPYVSIGKLLIEKGIFGDDITAGALKTWLRSDLLRGRAIMNRNPSYVFFRVLETDPCQGPMATLGCPATTGRTLAVDPGYLPLGTPVWIEVDGIARLCIAQDTGSAIKGPGRADLFFGTGDEAGVAAGRFNHSGKFMPLLRR